MILGLYLVVSKNYLLLVPHFRSMHEEVSLYLILSKFIIEDPLGESTYILRRALVLNAYGKHSLLILGAHGTHVDLEY